MENNYDLKKFVDFGSRIGNYFISFNKSGFIISSGFYFKENIKDYSRAVLYFDNNKKAVGIQLTKDDNIEGGFKLIHSNNGTSGSISARSFVLTNNLNKTEYFGRKAPKKINYPDIGEIYVIDLISESQNTNNLI